MLLTTYPMQESYLWYVFSFFVIMLIQEMNYTSSSVVSVNITAVDIHIYTLYICTGSGHETFTVMPDG